MAKRVSPGQAGGDARVHKLMKNTVHVIRNVQTGRITRVELKTARVKKYEAISFKAKAMVTITQPSASSSAKSSAAIAKLPSFVGMLKDGAPNLAARAKNIVRGSNAEQ